MSLYVRYPSNIPGSGGGGGSSNGLVKVKLYDPLTTSVTAGPAIVSPFVVDGITIATGDTVLFSNLSTGNNEIYLATVAGSVISWAAQNSFNGIAAPTAGDLVVITDGTAFANQTGEFNSTTWVFNNPVRYFNGADYFEQSALITSTLTDNTVSGTVFSVAYTGSENQVIEYSIIRSGIKEAGTLVLTTDGTTVALSSGGSATGLTGITFDGVISGSDVVLQYTSTSTGSDALMKYNIRRWSDASGGPAGVPTYTSASATVAAAGVNSNIQINSSGVLGASSNFSFDSINGLLQLGGLDISVLNSTSIVDNQVAPATLFSIPTSYNAVSIDYSVSRGSDFRTGRIIYSTDGISVSITGDYVEQGTTGITVSAAVSGGNVDVQYVSTSTGSGGTFKYSFRRWSA